jgi:hypothetical protein
MCYGCENDEGRKLKIRPVCSTFFVPQKAVSMTLQLGSRRRWTDLTTRLHRESQKREFGRSWPLPVQLPAPLASADTKP